MTSKNYELQICNFGLKLENRGHTLELRMRHQSTIDYFEAHLIFANSQKVQAFFKLSALTIN